MSRRKIKKLHLRELFRQTMNRSRYSKAEWIEICKKNKLSKENLQALDCLSYEELDQLRREVEALPD